MAIFCTKCGTKNEEGAAFCDNCGNALRQPLAPAPVPQSGPDVAPTAGAGGALPMRSMPGRPKTVLYASLALATVLVLGGAAMYFVLQAPSPTPANLLAAAKLAYGKSALEEERSELCLSNTDYTNEQLNIDQQDYSFRQRMDALVVAGLYSPPVQITKGGGFFQQTVLQYIATPELAKYREGTRLCLAKGVEVAGVSDIQKPLTKSGNIRGKKVQITGTEATMTLQALGAAPWLDQPRVRNLLLQSKKGWIYEDKKLLRPHLEVFVLTNNKWTAGPSAQDRLESLAANGQNDENAQGKSSKSGSNAEPSASIGSKLKSLFSFGGHPLKGTWRSMATKQMGVELPAGLAPDITFTADSMESGGGSTKCDFEVDGSRVTVTPKGQSQSLIFVMEGKDIMMAKALGFRYERVK